MATKAAKKPGRVPEAHVAVGKQTDWLGGYMGSSPTYVRAGGTTIVGNPDPIVREEAGNSGAGVYDEMLDRDAHMAGIVDTRFTAAVTLPRGIKAAQEEGPAKAIADVVQLVLDRWDTFEQDVTALLMSIVRGYAVGEVEYSIAEDGVVGIRRVHDCRPDQFVFDIDGNLRMRTVDHQMEGVVVPPRKFVAMTYRATATNPYGVGIGRSLWWMYYMKKHGLKSWLVAIEKFGVPTVWIKHPIGTSKSKRDALLTAGDKLQTGTTIATSTDVDLQFVATARGGNGGQPELLGYIDDQIARRVLGQTLTSSASSTGLGSSTGTEHGKVRQDILEHDAHTLIMGTLNATVIRWIVDFNFGPQPPEYYPTLEIQTDPPEDTNVLSQRDERLVRLGVPMTLAYFYERYGVPEPKEGDVLINDKLAAQEQASMPPGLNPFEARQPTPEPDEDDGDDEQD